MNPVIELSNDGYWIVYQHSDVWGKYPILRTKRKEEAELMYKYVTEA